MSTDPAERFDDAIVGRLHDIQTRRRIGWVLKIVAVVAVAVFFVLAYGVVGFSISEMMKYWPEFAQALAGYFPTTTYFGVVPFLDVGRYWQFIVAEKLFQQSIVTVSMAFLGTLLGLPGALLLGTLGSERIMPFPFNFVFRGTMSIIRAVPALVWALIFIPLGGVTPFTGTLAIATDTMGYLGRLFTDELEEIGDGPIEGIESTGAGKRQVVFFGMLSQVMRQYIAWAMYIFELNVRIAITLGLIGAGGLGYVMMIQRQTFQYTNMMAAIFVSVVLLLSIEMTSQRIRSYLRNDETQGVLELLKGLPRRWAESATK
jgi:phosphonate transport system permease protein